MRDQEVGSLIEMQNNIVMLLTAKIDERANGLEDMVRENTMKIEAMKKSVDFIFGELRTFKSDMKKVVLVCQENEKKVAELEQKVNEAERYQRRWNLRLHGIPEQADEDIKCRVVDICGAVIPESKATLQENVDIVHRLGRLKDQDKRLRTTIIRFTKRSTRDLLWR
jgi:DNA repair ATPase RecN